MRDVRIAKALLAAALFAVMAAVYMVPPENSPLPTCEFRALTGHSCLTCGLTRSLHAISHGELAESIRHHLMGPAVFIFMLLSFIVLSLEAVSGKRLKIGMEGKGRWRVVVLLGVVWLTYWGARLITEFVT